MKRSALFVLAISISLALRAQTPTSTEIIKNSVNYHDPESEWQKLNGKFKVLSERGTVDLILVNNKGHVEWTQMLKDGRSITGGYIGDSCYVKIDGKSVEPKGEIENFLLDCPQIIGRSNYWLYMYGLPMKLQDKQAVVDPKPEKVVFLDEEYWRIKVHYNSPDGDRWQFYFDTDSFRFAIAQYFHPAVGDDNEYIVYDRPIEVGKMVLPSRHSWYMHKNQEFIGDETLTIQPD